MFIREKFYAWMYMHTSLAKITYTPPLTIQYHYESSSRDYTFCKLHTWHNPCINEATNFHTLSTTHTNFQKPECFRPLTCYYLPTAAHMLATCTPVFSSTCVWHRTCSTGLQLPQWLRPITLYLGVYHEPVYPLRCP